MPMNDDSVNPLLNIVFHVPFDHIRAEHVQPAIAGSSILARVFFS